MILSGKMKTDHENYLAQCERANELGLPVPGAGAGTRHNYEKREFHGRSHRKGGRRVRDMRDALITE